MVRFGGEGFFLGGGSCSQLCFDFISLLSVLDGDSASLIPYIRCRRRAGGCAQVASAMAGHVFHSF